MAKRKPKSWNRFFEPQKQTCLYPRTADEAIQLLNERVRQLNLDLKDVKKNSWLFARDERERTVLTAIIAIFSTLEME